MFRRALVVDDDEVWLNMLLQCLERGGVQSLHVATNLDAGLEKLAVAADLLVCEVILHRRLCFPLLREAASLAESPTVLAVSQHATPKQVFRLRDYGVCAYLQKPFDATAVQGSLRELADARDAPVVEPPVSTPPFCEDDVDLTPAIASCRKRLGLTGVEADVLRFAVGGMSRCQIARHRCVSINTVKSQVRSLLDKSGCTSMRQLVALVRHEATRLAPRVPTGPSALLNDATALPAHGAFSRRVK